MNKPRLCEIFGVDVNEDFRFKGINSVWCYINEKGLLFSGDTYNDEALIDVLLEAINEPEKYIIHKRKWTSEEFKNAKAIRQLYPTATTIRRDDSLWHSTGVLAPKDDGKSWWMLTSLRGVIFPSLTHGEEASLDDILNAEVKDNDRN